jgi:hypothetical protein
VLAKIIAVLAMAFGRAQANFWRFWPNQIFRAGPGR